MRKFDVWREETITCCLSDRPWEGWTTAAKDLEMIFPEVSRVTRGRVEGQSVSSVTRELFNQRQRATVGSVQ